MAPNKLELLKLMQKYKSYDAQNKLHHDAFMKYLEETEDVFGNTNSDGHVTASVWIYDVHTKEVLLTHHMKLNKWLQLGGHTERTESIFESALREAEEESGLSGLTLKTQEIFDVDVHEIPSRGLLKAHFHYDVRFLIEGTNNNKLIISDESKDLKWIKLTELVNYTTEWSVTRMVDKTNLLYNLCHY